MRLQDWEVRKASSKLNLTPGERLVLFTLNSYGENIFPTLKTALEDTGLSKQGYYNCRKSLEDQGIILVSHKSTAKATEITINYPYLSTVLTSVSTELTNLSTELTSLSTEYEHNTRTNTTTNIKEKTNDTQAMKSPGIDDQSSLAKNNDTSNDESCLVSKADKEPGAKSKEFRLSTELTNPYEDMTDEERAAYIDSLEPEPIAHTGWRVHRGML